MANGAVEMVLLMGGGHIASFSRLDQPVNPLWQPPWPTSDPALRRLAGAPDFEPGPEGELLSSIAGHSLCLDVFGSHSSGEVKAGMSYHGEAGQVVWELVSVSRSRGELKVTLEARLPLSALEVERVFILHEKSPFAEVRETVRNLAGFERALGRAQHVSLGPPFIGAGCRYSCNADKGRTWPEATAKTSWAYKADADFDYPAIPLRGGGVADWRRFPRGEKPQGGLLTLRLRPEDEWGWFSALNPDLKTVLVYAWRREEHPWLVTWEENRSRRHKPWNGRTLVRGLEFSSYAFPLSRRRNVEMGRLFDVPCFEWLDAGEERTATFWMGLIRVSGDLSEAPVLDKGGRSWINRLMRRRFSL